MWSVKLNQGVLHPVFLHPGVLNTVFLHPGVLHPVFLHPGVGLQPRRNVLCGVLSLQVVDV